MKTLLCFLVPLGAMLVGFTIGMLIYAASREEDRRQRARDTIRRIEAIRTDIQAR